MLSYTAVTDFYLQKSQTFFTDLCYFDCVSFVRCCMCDFSEWNVYVLNRNSSW